jgi:Oxidoreductase family, NAD-binding Rossmann fold
MSEQGFSRRHFFYGALLAGAVPAGGFGSVPSLTMLGYKSPNEKLNLAAIGTGAQGFASISGAVAGVENVVALADVDWLSGQQGFATYERATKYKDFRQMLDKQSKEIDAVTIGIPDHNHAYAALACMQLGKHVYVQKPLTRTAGEARMLAQAQAKYPKVATQMGNQGYSHEATRVACEIIWSGEIGDVTEVHAFQGRPGWPQEMTKIPPPTPIPDTLDWDAWLGTAAYRPFTAGDQEYLDFIVARNARSGRGGGAAGAAAGAPGAAPAGAAGAAAGGRGGAAPGATGAAAAPGRGTPEGPGGQQYGFYLPFNWRGFYDFGSSLIGDWGVHILGPANWGLQLDPKYLISVECIKKDMLPPFTFPDEMTIKYEFGPRPGMPPVTVYWYQHPGGDAYTPPGMTVDQVRKIAGKGPEIAAPVPGGAGRGGPGGPGGPPGAAGAPGAAAGRAGAAAGRAGAAAGAAGGAPGAAAGGQPAAGAAAAGRGGGPQQGSGYNCIFVGTKGYMGTSGRGEGVGLIPGSRWAEYKLPTPYLQRSPGHSLDWVRACKGGAPACSNFSIAGPYTEWLVSGSAAVHFEGKLMWNNATGEFTNGKQVLQWVKPTYRKGWEMKL